MTQPISIILATRNEYKIKEIEQILGSDIEIRLIKNVSDVVIPEFGRSLMENSLTKAAFAYKVSGKPSLADDSGLFVEALDGAPGVYSSRYGQTDEERIENLLNNLLDKKSRRAKFKAVFVYYYDAGKYEIFDGECQGEIAKEPRGSNGFGYDPVFIPEGYDKTFAELGPKVKNRISHRGKALEKFKKYLLSEGTIKRTE